jgi:signal transduction histidine kinase
VSVIRQSHVDHVLRHLAQGASLRKQERFFNFLALHLAAALCADYVLIGEVAADDSRKIATLGFVARGKMRTKIAYDFSHGPCRQLLRQKKICIFRSGLQKIFPRSDYLRKFGVESFVGAPLFDTRGRTIGVIAVMARRPLHDPTPAVWLLRMAADRAASEVERRIKDEAWKVKQDGLSALTHLLVNFQENERREIMRELHDGISQELALLKLKLQGLRAACKSETDQAAYNEASTILHGIAGQAQKLSSGLRPPILDDLGVQAAVRWYLNHHAGRFGFAARLKCRRWGKRPKRRVEVACYRVVQEALTNAARHAGAKKVWLGLKRKGTGLQVSIRDDGVGFDAARITKLAPRKGQAGLSIMRKRVQAAGGRLRVVSGKGKGTELRASFTNAFH